jgi:hypothetical protein
MKEILIPMQEEILEFQERDLKIENFINTILCISYTDDIAWIDKAI